MPASARGARKAVTRTAKAARKRYSPRRSTAERREQVLDAALAIVDERGFASCTVEAVAARSDVAKTVVYRVAGNQEELVRKLFAREQRRALRDVGAALPRTPFSDPERMLVDGIRTLLERVRRHPATWRLILLPREGAPPAFRKEVDRHRARLRKQLEPIVGWGLSRLGSKELDAEIATYALLASIENAIRMTLDEPERFTPDRLAEFARAFIRTIT